MIFQNENLDVFLESSNFTISQKIAKIFESPKTQISPQVVNFMVNNYNNSTSLCRLQILRKLALLDCFDNCMDEIFSIINDVLEKENILFKYYAVKIAKILIKSSYSKAKTSEHINHLFLFIMNLPFGINVNEHTIEHPNPINQLTLDDATGTLVLTNRKFTSKELNIMHKNYEQFIQEIYKDNEVSTQDHLCETILFLSSSLCLEYFCDFSLRYGVKLDRFAEILTKITEGYFTIYLKEIKQIAGSIHFIVSSVAFFSIAKSPSVPNFINLSFMNLKLEDYRNKKKLLYILIQTKTPLTKTVISNTDFLSIVKQLFIEDDLKSMFLEILLISKVSEFMIDKLLVNYFLGLNKHSKPEIIEKIINTHMFLLNQTPSLIRLQYSLNICAKLIDVVHNSVYCRDIRAIFIFIQTVIGYVIHTKMNLTVEEKEVFCCFLMAPIKLNHIVKDFYSIFRHLKQNDQQYVLQKCTDDILLKYLDRFDTWKELLEIEMFGMVLCLAANKLVLNDFCFNRWNYVNVFKITYHFFNYDKKYYTMIFQYYFPKIISIMIHNISKPRKIFEMLNDMFLSITPQSYVGYYVVFNNFNSFIEELFSLYTLTNDTFYLNTLFNIPISLGLLISKCNIIRKPMEQGIRLHLYTAVLMYLDYIVEFDANGEYSSLLDDLFIILKYTRDPKILNICNKFTTCHRKNFHKKILEEQGDSMVNELLMSLCGKLILRVRNGEIEMISLGVITAFSSDELVNMYINNLCEIDDVLGNKKQITRENILFMVIFSKYQNVVSRLQKLHPFRFNEDLRRILHFLLIYNWDAGVLYINDNNILCVINNLTQTLYSPNDLISNRSISVLKTILTNILKDLNYDVILDLTLGLKYKLLTNIGNRVFYAIRDVFDILFSTIEYRQIFMKVFDKDCYKTINPFLKSMYLYFEYKYFLGPSIDIVKDLDSEFLLNNNLKFYPSLYDHVEIFIKFINDKSKFIKFFDFYEKMKSQAVVNYNNNIDFEEFLKPVKRFLPSLAVIDGFIDLCSKEDFIETINRNEKISTENPNSIEVFRNLLYNSKFKLVDIFIELFNTQSYYYKLLIYQLLLNIKEYNPLTLEFLIINEVFNEKKIIDLEKVFATKEYIDNFINLLIEKIEYPIVRNSLKYSKTYINQHSDIKDKINNRVVYVLNSNVKKFNFYLLDYLMYFNIKYKNTKLIIETYINGMYTMQGIDKLIHFYYTVFTNEEKEFLILNNPYLIKYLNTNFTPTIPDIKLNETSQTPPQHYYNGHSDPVHNFELSKIYNLHGAIEMGLEIGIYKSNDLIHYSFTTDLWDEELTKKRKQKVYKMQHIITDTDVKKIIESNYIVALPKSNNYCITTEHKVPNRELTIAYIKILLINHNDNNIVLLNEFLTNNVDTNTNIGLLLTIFKICLEYKFIEITVFEKLLKLHTNAMIKIMLTTNILNSYILNNLYLILYYVDKNDAFSLISIHKTNLSFMTHAFCKYPEIISLYQCEFVKIVNTANKSIATKLLQLQSYFELDYDSLHQNEVIAFISTILADGYHISLQNAIKICSNKEKVMFYYNLLKKFPGIKFIFDLVLHKDDLYNYYLAIEDKEMFLGLIKYTSNVREVRAIAQKLLHREYTQAYLQLRETIGKITNRIISYTKRDFLTLHVLSFFILGKLYQNNLREDEYINHFSTYYNQKLEDKLEQPFSFTNHIFHNFIVNYTSTTINLNEKLWIMLGELPKGDAFNKTILYLGLLGEIIESKKIKEEFINGRFKMWMNRYPLYDFVLYNKWRSFIFNHHTNNKVNSLICQIKCLYAEYLMKNKLYKQAQFILNEINKLSSIELNQNFHKTMLDIECCSKLGENKTIIEIINSINVSRYTNEDKSKLYFEKYKHSGDEYFYKLSKNLYVLESHKAKELDDLQAMYNDQTNVGTTTSLYENIKTKLVDFINTLSIPKSRKYIIQLYHHTNGSEDVKSLIKDKSKLYWFDMCFNTETIDLILNKTPLYSPITLMNEYERLRDDYNDIAEIYCYKKSGDNYELILTTGIKKYVKFITKQDNMSNIKFKEATNTIKYEESKQKVDMSSNSEDNHYYNTKLLKCIEMVNYSIFKKVNIFVTLQNVIIGKNLYKPLNTSTIKSLFHGYECINDWYRFKHIFIRNYCRWIICFLYYKCSPKGINVDHEGNIYIEEVLKNDTIQPSKIFNTYIQDLFGIDGLNGPLISQLHQYKTQLRESDIELYNTYFNIEGNLWHDDIEKILNGEL